MIHLLARVAAKKLENKSSEAKKIITTQRIELTIKIWRTIDYLTKSQTIQNLQTIDIPEDESIKWNDIKSHKDHKLKIIDDTELIDKYIAEINIHHLFQAHGYPFLPSNQSNH